VLNGEVIPKLRINGLYADILRRNRDNSGRYLASQLQEAKWMIKNVQQRFDTILRVSQAIIDRSAISSNTAKWPCAHWCCAKSPKQWDCTNSTISRVTTQKYMLTPKGIFELKYFFGSHVATDAAVPVRQRRSGR